MPLTRNQIMILHIAKNRLCLDDDSYRDALEAHGGARSSKGLDFRGYLAVMKHFERCGFERVNKNLKSEISDLRSSRAGMATEKQKKKIYALWWSLRGYYEKGNEYKALRGFLKNRFNVEHERFLDFETAHNVIEAIKAISRRGAKTRRSK